MVSDGKDDEEDTEDDFVHADPIQTIGSGFRYSDSPLTLPVRYGKCCTPIGQYTPVLRSYWSMQTCHQGHKTVTKIICQVTETFYSAGNNSMVKPKRHGKQVWDKIKWFS